MQSPHSAHTEATSKGRLPDYWRHIIALLCVVQGSALLILLVRFYGHDHTSTRLLNLATISGALGGTVDFSWRTLGREEARANLTFSEFWNAYIRGLSGAIVGIVIWSFEANPSQTGDVPHLIGLTIVAGAFSSIVFGQLFTQLGLGNRNPPQEGSPVQRPRSRGRDRK